MAAIDGILKPV